MSGTDAMDADRLDARTVSPYRKLVVKLAWLACGLFCLGTPSSLLAASNSMDPSSCNALARLALPGTKITAAALVPAGDFQLPEGSSSKTLTVSDFCRV